MKKYPVLFNENETSFKTNGIGVLSDAVQCDVTEELNGVFELTLIYPANGTYLKELKNRRFIYADASHEMGMQPFRIYRIMKLTNGLVTVYAQHISYDLGGIQLPPFKAVGTADAMEKVKTYSTTENPFSYSSTMVSNEEFETETPKSVRAYLLGEKDSFLQVYGGEFKFDKFNIVHMSRRGADNGYRIKYGVNLIDLNQEESIESTYTGIYPYYKDEYMFMDLTESYDLFYKPDKVDTSKLAGKIIYVDGTFSHSKVANVDLSAEFEIAPLSTDELKEVAEQYMKDNSIGVPTVSLDVRFESLRSFPEYKDIMFMEDVNLGDTISVDFVKLGVSAKARIITVIYDSLRHKIKRVSVGDAKNNIADTVTVIQNAVKESATQLNSTQKTVAKLSVQSSGNAAIIEAIASRVTDTETNIANLQISVVDNTSNIKTLAGRVTDTEENIAYLEIDVDDHAAQLEAIAKWQSDTEISISEINEIADANKASIEAITSWQGTTDQSIASIKSEASYNAAKINLLVETSESGENTVRGSVLVEAINGQSTATIKADKVNLTGYVTVTDLGDKGTTVIDGSRVQTGQIISKNFLDEAITLVSEYMNVTNTVDDFEGDPYSYQFSGNEVVFFLGEEYGYNSYTFTLSKEFSSGSIVLKKDGSITVRHDDGTIETTDIQKGNGKTVFSVDISAILSNDGMSIDLNEGDIRSSGFAFVGNRAYFSGMINTEQKSKIASWNIGDSIKTTIIAETDSAQSTYIAELTEQNLRWDFVSDTVSGQHVESYADYGITGFTNYVKESYQEYSCIFYYGGMILEDSLGVYKSEDGSYMVGVDFVKITNNNSGKTYRIAVDEETMTVKAILDS